MSSNDPLQCNPPVSFQALHRRLALQDPPRAARLVAQYRTAIDVYLELETRTGVDSSKTGNDEDGDKAERGVRAKKKKKGPKKRKKTTGRETRTDPVVPSPTRGSLERETRTDPVVPSPTRDSLALETRTDPVVPPHPRTDPVVRPHPWRPRQTQAQREEMWLNGRTVFRDLRTNPAQTARYCSVQ